MVAIASDGSAPEESQPMSVTTFETFSEQAEAKRLLAAALAQPRPDRARG